MEFTDPAGASTMDFEDELQARILEYSTMTLDVRNRKRPQDCPLNLVEELFHEWPVLFIIPWHTAGKVAKRHFYVVLPLSGLAASADAALRPTQGWSVVVYPGGAATEYFQPTFEAFLRANPTVVTAPVIPNTFKPLIAFEEQLDQRIQDWMTRTIDVLARKAPTSTSESDVAALVSPWQLEVILTYTNSHQWRHVCVVLKRKEDAKNAFNQLRAQFGTEGDWTMLLLRRVRGKSGNLKLWQTIREFLCQHRTLVTSSNEHLDESSTMALTHDLPPPTALLSDSQTALGQPGASSSQQPTSRSPDSLVPAPPHTSPCVSKNLPQSSEVLPIYIRPFTSAHEATTPLMPDHLSAASSSRGRATDMVYPSATPIGMKRPRDEADGDTVPENQHARRRHSPLWPSEQGRALLASTTGGSSSLLATDLREEDDESMNIFVAEDTLSPPTLDYGGSLGPGNPSPLDISSTRIQSAGPHSGMHLSAGQPDGPSNGPVASLDDGASVDAIDWEKRARRYQADLIQEQALRVTMSEELSAMERRLLGMEEELQICRTGETEFARGLLTARRALVSVAKAAKERHAASVLDGT